MIIIELWKRFRGNGKPPEYLASKKEYNVDMVPKLKGVLMVGLVKEQMKNTPKGVKVNVTHLKSVWKKILSFQTHHCLQESSLLILHHGQVIW
ncbi:guanosine nucleotide diphosphate dissociation inhibitor At5g09550-like isoform X1 [Asparagus officinalis]|uniref:guanosine nucleotide diphosphate dissociation inhibitor At5g09550-like isoform X1 n=1 Tax=Asparagus officinalis TaxID=4686 RepID=UPI00098E33F0|nr:guanosine nucleotide diphosphate dissociation inhibitor At5g09550-like isoform X1 [Asparagus officinalis]